MCVVQPCVNTCVCPGVCARSAACLKLDRRAAALPLFACGGKTAGLLMARAAAEAAGRPGRN